MSAVEDLTARRGLALGCWVQIDRRRWKATAAARLVLLFVSLFGSSIRLKAQRPGFDTGVDLLALPASLTEATVEKAAAGYWIRVRGVPMPPDAVPERLDEARSVLRALHRRGLHVCVLVSLLGVPPADKKASGQIGSLPTDLRKAEAQFADLTRAYCGLVDAWELENEPDLGFVPENAEAYAAYLKACYLGVKRGDLGSNGTGKTLMLMGPLGLPPGPYLNTLIRNDLLGYTDGFNYHYYGYAEDFTGVYRQFESAIQESARDRLAPLKRLPVFLTECGYGMLGDESAATREGRIRQWRWFRDVTEQIERLRPAAPMMFLLRPYFERGLNEFGLEMAARAGLSFQPQDFGESRPAHWMERIGSKDGFTVVSPALAFLRNNGDMPPYEPQSWTVRVGSPSPIVMDFRVVRGMRAVKSFQGYALSHDGVGELRIYNFSNRRVSGQVRSVGMASSLIAEFNGSRIELQPGELRLIQVHLAMALTPWKANSWTVKFVPDLSPQSPAIFSTVLYPEWTNSPEMILASFNHTELAADGLDPKLDEQPRAQEEPAFVQEGAWRVTQGIHVRSLGGDWVFSIDALPFTALRPAVAELPLGDRFVIPLDSLLRFELRCGSAGPVPTRYANLDAAKGGVLQVQFLMANGNRYEVWPRRLLTESWETYEEGADNFTMSFFGRANLPWKFRDNRPVALVFTFWPRSLPTVALVRSIGLVRPN